MAGQLEFHQLQRGTERAEFTTNVTTTAAAKMKIMMMVMKMMKNLRRQFEVSLSTDSLFCLWEILTRCGAPALKLIAEKKRL